MISSILRYSKNFLSYYTLLFILVISSNIIAGNFVLADYLYLFFCVVAFSRTYNLKRNPKVFLYVLYFVLCALLVYSLYSNFRGLMSSCRFILGILFCSILFYSYNNVLYREKIVKGYGYACVFLSIFVIIQFISYYVLHINIDLSFGDYAASADTHANAAGFYDPLKDLFYRTGGLFNEPSWFAAYVSPSCFILTRNKSYKEAFVVIVGLLMSTSGLGFVVLAIYLSWLILQYNKTIGIVVALLFLTAYIGLPFIFERASQGVDGGSFEARITIPFTKILQIPELSIFGINPAYHYDRFGEPLFFANTLTFIYIYFGIIGLFVFFKYVYFKRFFALTIAILAIISIEGLYGRIDFWMMVLACKIYSSQMLEEKRSIMVDESFG